MRLSKRAFVGKLDFRTSPGFLEGGEARNKLRMPGGGPQLVVTDKALFDFDTPEHEMRLISLHPGVPLESVLEEIGWPVRLADPIGRTEAPVRAELDCIRQELDPAGEHRT
jgi:glutaconate CoA-transferase subunit B